MTNQKLSTYLKEIPDFLRPKYLIKRINEDDIEVTESQRDSVLRSLEAGIRFIQINNYTLMLNSIKSIDPKYGKHNIPPRPREVREATEITNNTMGYIVSNQDEIDAWDYWYGNKLSEYSEQLKKIDAEKETDKHFMFFEVNWAEDDGVKKISERVAENREKLVEKYGEIKSSNSLVKTK